MAGLNGYLPPERASHRARRGTQRRSRAAYRARYELTDERTGLVHDYNRKAGTIGKAAAEVAPKISASYRRNTYTWALPTASAPISAIHLCRAAGVCWKAPDARNSSTQSLVPSECAPGVERFCEPEFWKGEPVIGDPKLPAVGSYQVAVILGPSWAILTVMVPEVGT